jgi:hypothetical protein
MIAEVSQALSANHYPKAHTIANGNEVLIAGHVVRVNIAKNLIVDLSLFEVGQNAVRATVTGDHVKRFFELLQTDAGAYTSGTYRNVKANAVWRATYNTTDDVMWEYDHRQHGRMYISEAVVACRACGIRLPLKVMTVDHQMPQAGGEIGAICRVFRGYGLTKGAPKGAKNKAAVARLAKSVGGVVAPLATWADRYTFNEAGAIYYSIVREANQLQALANSCMNNMLNLRPACGPCNSRLRNSGAF